VSKKIDQNGFWKIEDNPLSKVGVFPYLGKQISDELEPDKIYMVYRPANELFNKETIDSFNLVPLVNDHEMIGEGYTPAEDKGVDGVINNVKAKGNVLIGDIKIFSESMKDDIKSGKKELSMGYTCSYDISSGVFQGERYEAIQKDIRGNHVALVERGRMGSDVRVYDKLAFDTLYLVQEFNEKEKDMNAKEKHQAIDAKEDLEKEEQAEDTGKEETESEDEAKEEAEAEDAEEEVEDSDDEEKESEDEEEESEKSAKDKSCKDSKLKKTVDGMAGKIMRMLDERDDLVKKSPRL
jgi:hypothetical protein